MLSLTYVSTATQPLSASELKQLLVGIRPRNEARGLSGLLLYREGNIIQTLEGPEDAVTTAFAAIERDPRHKGVLVLLREQIERPLFPDWSMGFHELSADEVAGTEGYSGFLRQRPAAELDGHPEPAYRLLELFRENMR